MHAYPNRYFYRASNFVLIFEQIQTIFMMDSDHKDPDPLVDVKENRTGQLPDDRRKETQEFTQDGQADPKHKNVQRAVVGQPAGPPRRNLGFAASVSPREGPTSVRQAVPWAQGFLRPF